MDGGSRGGMKHEGRSKAREERGGRSMTCKYSVKQSDWSGSLVLAWYVLTILITIYYYFLAHFPSKQLHSLSRGFPRERIFM